MQMETFDTLFILKLAYLNLSAVKQFFPNVQAKETIVKMELEVLSSSECVTPHWGVRQPHFMRAL